MRSEFERLEGIRKIMNENGIYFMNHSGWYEARDFKDFEYEQYINGAWYAFQEQQKQIDEALRYVIDHGGYDDLTHVINILKGNKDEN